MVKLVYKDKNYKVTQTYHRLVTKLQLYKVEKNTLLHPFEYS